MTGRESPRKGLYRPTPSTFDQAQYLYDRLILVREVGGFTGVSSDALVLHALGGPEPASWEYPNDRGDWRRCLLAYALAPHWLRDRMRPTMRAFSNSLRASGDDWRWRWTFPVKRPALGDALSRIESFRRVEATV